MFSVDNFYVFFKSHYGWKETKTMPWIFTPHGSKNLIDCHPYEDKPIYLNLKEQGILETSGVIILHDQEPFIHRYSLDIYRNTRYQKKKNDMWLQLSDEELWLSHWTTCSWPIICHSEKNSPDIRWLQDLGVIDCYYFYHGLIARDWFRHWKHHNDLFGQRQLAQKFLLYVRDCTGTRQYRQTVLEKLQPMKNQIKSNWGLDSNIGSNFSAKIVVEDALDTGIQLVLETLFEGSKIYVTEKVFKPMVMMQPFIIFAGPGTLEYLRSYGFQTFDTLWDESYDVEPDSDKRMEKIIGVIENLYNMSESEFNDIISKTLPIVQHNQRHFFSEKFEELLLNEFHQNVRNSITLQKQKMITDPGGSWFWMYDKIHQRGIEIDEKFQSDTDQIISQLKTQDIEKYLKIKQQYPWVQ